MDLTARIIVGHIHNITRVQVGRGSDVIQIASWQKLQQRDRWTDQSKETRAKRHFSKVGNPYLTFPMYLFLSYVLTTVDLLLLSEFCNLKFHQEYTQLTKGLLPLKQTIS